jgi:hypothetical protein
MQQERAHVSLSLLVPARQVAAVLYIVTAGILRDNNSEM